MIVNWIVFQKDPRIVFSNGILKVTGEKEPNIRPKRWPVSNVAAFGAQNIVDSFIEICPYEDEDGELNSKEVRQRAGNVMYKDRC